MSSKPRGRALIINNEEFEHLPNRDGTLRDRQALETLFKAFYFDTTVVKNKKAAVRKIFLPPFFHCFLLVFRKELFGTLEIPCRKKSIALNV